MHSQVHTTVSTYLYVYRNLYFPVEVDNGSNMKLYVYCLCYKNVGKLNT